MTKLHRKELKQDEIREKFAEAIRSVSLHGREVIFIVGIVIAVGLIAFGWFYYERNQQEESQNLLGIAMEKFAAPVGPAPADPGAQKPKYNYKTEEEKYKDASKDFEEIVRLHGNTPAADMARYQAGVCAFYLKDYKKAEEYLLQAGKVSDRNVLYFQSRIALANLYNLTSRSADAAKVLDEAIRKDKSLVPPEYLMFQSAEALSKAGKTKEAIDTFQKILDQYKDSPVSYQAQARLNELKRN